MSQPETQLSGFYDLINSHSLDKNTAYRWITMSFAPREGVEKYIATRER
jgi:hypothetical protein